MRALIEAQHRALVPHLFGRRGRNPDRI